MSGYDDLMIQFRRVVAERDKANEENAALRSDLNAARADAAAKDDFIRRISDIGWLQLCARNSSSQYQQTAEEHLKIVLSDSPGSALLAELDDLRESARRFYHADGTFELLDSPEAVIAMRIEAAKRIERAEADAAAMLSIVKDLADISVPTERIMAASFLAIRANNPGSTLLERHREQVEALEARTKELESNLAESLDVLKVMVDLFEPRNDPSPDAYAQVAAHANAQQVLDAAKGQKEAR